MNNSKTAWLTSVVVLFPLFFILHAVNEQFGLLRVVVIAILLVYYLVVAVISWATSKYLLKDRERATLFTFILLCVFFFFGAARDLLKGAGQLSFLGAYRYMLPATVIFVFACFVLLKRTKIELARAGKYIKTLLLVFVVFEISILVFNAATNKERQKDLGDIDHSLLNEMNVAGKVRMPFIFWIVMDEYSGSTGLKNGWNFTNPLDTILRNRQFFVADSARSPYNYTHYSLVASLDMQYLHGLTDHSVIGYRDIVRGNISLRNTNVVEFLKRRGYDVVNHTIYNLEDEPTRAREYFVNADFKLVDNQTLIGRIRQDLGWHFQKDDVAEGLADEGKHRLRLLDDGLRSAKDAFARNSPTLFMYHYMFTHEPFIYNADGTSDFHVGFGMHPERYIPSIQYANRQLTGFVDALKTAAGDRELVIIIQGDHGYKFPEKHPLFDQEGCSILYAIYCSDHDYTGWKNSFNSVNGFRLLINKYFHTNLPILENRSVDLFYR